MFVNYNYPNWKTAHIMIPDLINKAFEVTAFGSGTQGYITWFGSDFTQYVPKEENYREIVGMITQAFIVRMIEKLDLEKQLTSEFTFSPNDEVVRARIQDRIYTILNKFHYDTGFTIQDEMSRFVLGMPTDFGSFKLEPKSKYYSPKYKEFVRFVTKLDIVKAQLEAEYSGLKRL
ncbi:hypothetical protein SP15_132 [Bacillus phage SP-15]|uniref:Uncharacterized protein n=1 Tax=Bacillus phage SP-15 TaxID=1792032 RepID=A0A127AWB3_9CAUD|nr:hypothetical protein SP15_132 [Bacillus phage SP-15]AMM44930.1 hypothetical protein SP15_132 [Bacillus phage SP-15]